ncbi:hypothetical protein GUITHDRAFT_155648 [Guillardia theta CCMP2712]|uniref:Uncharacterized protein n=1 Tax=Guillardia theta (strain CCMP2712) TaxID=905079 RepID=L1IFE7_GUITC|nr:hypothetical protein GUITHDRAFT_155648 [Guillardia theta CCMP2712]EKX34767.1 hypothetical protein GUITHDRAFT_155648 [Guillardia theta CCMP2712]|eukprot:XP_005821747.1 hypothetical protein GUITHDRAFT_155648 [Guillardia theta CCMP2712]
MVWYPEMMGRMQLLTGEDDGAAGAHEVDEATKKVAAEAMSGELMSFRTAQNIAHNKDNIDYCIDQFNYISNRIKCIRLMTGNGPYLS